MDSRDFTTLVLFVGHMRPPTYHHMPQSNPSFQVFIIYLLICFFSCCYHL